jgi:hypothetical protein
VDYRAILNELHNQRDKVNRAIEELEALQAGLPLTRKSNRGRKTMGAEERQEVSARMKRYWASRRKARR